MNDTTQPPAAKDEEQKEEKGEEPEPEKKPAPPKRTTDLTKDQQALLMRLVTGGKKKSEAIREVGCPERAGYRFFEAMEKKGELEKLTKAAETAEGAAQQAAEQVYVASVKREALQAARDRIKTGTFSIENYRDDARLSGLTVDEYGVNPSIWTHRLATISNCRLLSNSVGDIYPSAECIRVAL